MREAAATVHPWNASGFEWDDVNEEHLGQHGITADEVEEIFEDMPVWLPNKRSGSGDWLMIGTTHGGRWLAIVVQALEETNELRAFTGWPVSRQQREIYRRQRGR